jgi:hypothetical protein
LATIPGGVLSPASQPCASQRNASFRTGIGSLAPPLSGGLQAGDARITSIAQPPGFGEFRTGTFGPAFEATGGGEAAVEQKNGAVVRRTIGYRRFEGLEAAAPLARLYAAMRLFVNFFQPSFKLATKVRDGA